MNLSEHWFIGHLEGALQIEIPMGSDKERAILLLFESLVEDAQNEVLNNISKNGN